MTEIVMVVGFLIVGFMYFLPTVIAAGRRKRNAGAIFVLNLFLGWSLIGWVLALVWACAHETREA